jgi:hypothetical protein
LHTYTHLHPHERTHAHSHMQGAGSKERESNPRKDKESRKKTQQPALSAAAVLNKGPATKGPGYEVRESSGKPRGRPKVLKRPVTDLPLSSDTDAKGRGNMDALHSLAHMDGLNRQEKRMKHEAHDDSSNQPERAEKRVNKVAQQPCMLRLSVSTCLSSAYRCLFSPRASSSRCDEAALIITAATCVLCACIGPLTSL